MHQRRKEIEVDAQGHEGVPGDTVSGGEIGHVPMYNPEPPSVVAGRPFLYDTSFSSSHGDSSCASCHVNGDFDSLG